jgi:CubicO group peptidase (beta-lactamase class C family)
VFAFAPDRVYDLASLTKPLCTAEVVLRLVRRGYLALDQGHPRLPGGVTIRHLLQHSSGYPAWRPFFRETQGRGIPELALATPLDHPPGRVHTYSDVGFLALGAVIDTIAPLEELWAGPLRWGAPRSEDTGLGVGGPVHDENARAMGGIAPHAGLFGTAREVAEVAGRWLRPGALPEELRAEFLHCRGPGSHRLGWDAPSGPGSTAGADPPPDAVGHLGFTGTSLWLSPETGRVSVLLTNRVIRGDDRAPIRALRRAFHGAAWGPPPLHLDIPRSP